MANFVYSHVSMSRLITCQKPLQLLAHAYLDLGIMDAHIQDGARDKATQDEYFATGKSKLPWPEGKHCAPVPGVREESAAVDIVPVIDGQLSWNNYHCSIQAGAIWALSKQMGIPIRWGGNWDRDHEPITDQDFQDLVHFELDDEYGT